ncbi:MAG: family 16 glycosylhydrolase [Marmoricola sp.]
MVRSWNVRARTRLFVGLVAVVSAAALVPAIAPAQAAVRRAAVVSPCGTATVLKDDGTPWVCTFGDEFTGSKLDPTKWFVQTTANSGYNAGNACYTDSTQNVTQSFGTLKLVARKTSRPTTCASPSGSFSTNYSAGTVSTFNRFAQTGGRFEIRAKFPTSRLPGLQSALWMYPAVTDNVWPANGEIDIAEWYSQYYDRVIPYLHYATSYLDPNATNVNCTISNVGSWHTYTLEWTPTVIRFLYDDKLCMQNSAIAGNYPYTKPYMIVLSQMLGVGSNAPTSRTALPATTTVDYVHVWK